MVAESEEQVFAEALEAFGELIALDGGGEEEEIEVSVEARDRPALLVEWLEELIFLADTRSFVPIRAHDLRVEGGSLRSTIVGRRGRVAPLVKAATYHRLRFAHENEMWHARIVLDV